MVLAVFALWLWILPGSPDPMQPLREALEREDLDAALRELDQLRERSPADFEWNQLPYLQGVLLQRKGSKEPARRILERLVDSEFILADYALLHLIELSEEGPPQEGAVLRERFLQRYPDHPQWGRTALEYGRKLRRDGNLDRAKRWFDAAWRRGGGSVSRQAALEHARIHLDQKETSEGIRDLERLLVKNERDDAAYAAARLLDRLKPLSACGEGELRRMARVFLNNQDGEAARKYLGQAIKRFPGSLSADQHAFLWARSLVIDNRFKAAADAYQEAYRKFSESSWGEYSLYQSGNLALRLLDYPQAERHYRSLVEKHPASRYAPRAWFNLADTYLWLGQPEKARMTLQAALAAAPRKERDQFRYAMARLDLEEDQFASALQQLEKLDHLASTKLPSGVTREEIHFWKGMALEALAREQEARSAYRIAATGSPNYFAYLARRRLPEEVGQTPPASDEPWLRRLIQPRAWRTEPPSTPNPGDRIRDLLFLQLYDEAATEIARAGPSAAGGDRISQLFNLAYWADRGKLPETSIRAAERLQAAAFEEKAPGTYPEVVRSLLYPLHYWDFVSRYSSQSQVEPELVLSIIRQESRFQSDAKSIAAARGLMQLMSGTARQLARELTIEPPNEADLYRPELSVRLGAHYLKKLLDRFGGSVEKALAAYNGGPDNVERWAAKLNRPDAELFVANIGFRETKLYVLKVMGNYFTYKNLYAAAGSQPAGSGSVKTDGVGKPGNRDAR